MKTQRGWFVALVLAAGCATDDPHTLVDSTEEQAEASGTVQLKLTAVDSSGRSYRLRSADFRIAGYPDFPFPWGDGGMGGNTSEVIVSSETDPDAQFITQKLLPGQYYVSLLDSGWYLERLVAGGWEPVEQAVLLSEPTQYTYVYNGGISDVLFSFGVDGELIDFRNGDVRIGISIEQPGDGPSVDGGPAVDGGWWPPPYDAGSPQDAEAQDAGADEQDAGPAEP